MHRVARADEPSALALAQPFDHRGREERLLARPRPEEVTAASDDEPQAFLLRCIAEALLPRDPDATLRSRRGARRLLRARSVQHTVRIEVVEHHEPRAVGNGRLDERLAEL